MLATEGLQREVEILKSEVTELERRLQRWQDEETTRTAQVHEEAAKRGRVEGLAQAEARAQEVLREKMSRVHGLLGELRRQQAQRAEECEDVLVTIAFAAVCKLLGDHAAETVGVRQLVIQAAAELSDRDEVRVRLHPDDLALLSDPEHRLPVGFTLAPDPAIHLGGCFIESESGILDARLETQLAELATVLSATRMARRTGAKAML
jgi:flagellar assembly protein FliH